MFPFPGFGGGGGFPGARGTFEAHYRAMPIAFIDKPQAEYGDKVFLPPSALDRLCKGPQPRHLPACRRR